MKSDVKTNPRALALDLLIKADKAKQFSNIALDKALEGSSLSDADKRLASMLFYGVTEKKITLNYRISKLSNRPLEQIDDHTLNALRIGIYQLVFTDRIPPHAAINETVSLCPKRTAGFVNGILRTHTRKPQDEFPSKDTEAVKYLSVKYSVCEELCQRFVEEFSTDKTESIFASLDFPPPTTLRVNTLKTTRDELAANIDSAIKTQISPNGLKVKGAVRELFGFEDGLFFVQDEASQICVEALDAKAGMTVYDVCACPGSKSFGAAINMQNTGSITSFDLHMSKLSLIKKGAERLGIDIISVKEQDGRTHLPELIGTADRVLCDVPCSGFGVLAKKPELRYKDPAVSASLPKIQLDILNNACQYVKRGGVLVYSTCTVFSAENQGNVELFLQMHPDFELTPFSVGELFVNDGYVTLMPDEYPTDGFFIAKFTRK